MKNYLLLLHETQGTNAAELSADEIAQVIAEYRSWHEQLADQKRVRDSQKVRDDGGKSLIQRDGKPVVFDGPYAQAKELIGGYFLIAATDYEDAVEVSSSCPHLTYGGRIEIREIEPT
ncbi:MAG: YciI family protein [Myxococcota bacterium]